MVPGAQDMISLSDIEAARARLRGAIYATPATRQMAASRIIDLKRNSGSLHNRENDFLY